MDDPIVPGPTGYAALLCTRVTNELTPTIDTGGRSAERGIPQPPAASEAGLDLPACRGAETPSADSSTLDLEGGPAHDACSIPRRSCSVVQRAYTTRLRTPPLGDPATASRGDLCPAPNADRTWSISDPFGCLSTRLDVRRGVTNAAGVAAPLLLMPNEIGSATFANQERTSVVRAHRRPRLSRRDRQRRTPAVEPPEAPGGRQAPSLTPPRLGKPGALRCTSPSLSMLILRVSPFGSLARVRAGITAPHPRARTRCCCCRC
jgi:hypothetical protein